MQTQSALPTQQLLLSFRWERPSARCLDLAPMNHHFFRLLKQHSGDRRFHGNEEREMALREWVRMPEPYFQCHGNFKRLPTWNDGISELGYYAGK